MLKKISPFLFLIFSAFSIGYAKFYVTYKMDNPSIKSIKIFLIIASLALTYYFFKLFWHYKIRVLIPISIFSFFLIAIFFPSDEVMQKGYSPFSLPLSVSAGLATVGSILGAAIIWILFVKGAIFIYNLIRLSFSKS